MKDRTRLTTYVPRELAAVLAAMSLQEGRSMANLLESLLISHPRVARRLAKMEVKEDEGSNV